MTDVLRWILIVWALATVTFPIIAVLVYVFSKNKPSRDDIKHIAVTGLMLPFALDLHIKYLVLVVEGVLVWNERRKLDRLENEYQRNKRKTNE